jgi:hypothetical protein
MNSEIIATQTYVDSLKQKYQGLDVPFYKLREMFS